MTTALRHTSPDLGPADERAGRSRTLPARGRPAGPASRRLCMLAAALALQAVPALAAAQEAGEPAQDPTPKLLAGPGLPGQAGAGFGQRMRSQASDMVLAAMNFLGAPYRRGGDSADQGFDCSGFTRHIFEMSLGQVLPRRSEEQARAPGLVTVTRDELRPGDLVFFNTLRRSFSHVGIYVGEGRFIHSPRPGGEVRIEDMRRAYWHKRFNGARRTALAALAPQPAGAAD